MGRYTWSALLSCAVLSTSSFAPSAMGQTPDNARSYDALTAGAESYWYHEAQRRRDIDRQLGLVDQMKWNAALSPYFDQTIYYRGTPYHGSAPSLEYLYAAGRPGLFGRYRERVWFGGDVFEPWPIVAGHIWGYPFIDPIPQPIGQRQIQTSPHRWESHPVYAAPAESLPMAPPPAADRPSGGPREF